MRQWRATHALWVSLGVLLILVAARGSAHDAWIVGSALGLALLPAAIEGLTGVRLPRGFVLACGLFTVLTVGLGELVDFYQRLAWWDVPMHLAAGFVVAGIGLVAALTLLSHMRAHRAMVLPATFALFTGVGVSGIWELFEYALDARFGFSTQNASLVDTMHDLALGTAGALACAGLGALHVAAVPTGIFGRIVEGAVAENTWREPEAS